MFDVLLVIVFIGSAGVLWYRLSQKIPELVAVPDEVIVQRLHEDSARVRVFLLNIKHWWREEQYREPWWRFFLRESHISPAYSYASRRQRDDDPSQKSPDCRWSFEWKRQREWQRGASGGAGVHADANVFQEHAHSGSPAQEKKIPCQCSSAVEQRFCKAKVVGFKSRHWLELNIIGQVAP